MMENGNDPLDELLGILEDECQENNGGERCENETLYESAIADQTWFKSVKNPSEKENFSITSPSNSDKDDESTPVVTPAVSNIDTFEEDKIEDELASLRQRIDMLQNELSTRKQANSSAESLRRVSSLRSLLSESPNFFANPSSTPLRSNPDFVKGDDGSKSFEEHERKCNDESFEEKNPRIASSASHNVSELREKAKNVSEKLRRSISLDNVYLRQSSSDKKMSSSFDPFFDICVTNPNLSSVTFQSYIGARVKVRLSQLAVRKQVQWDDWVTMAVLVERSQRKKSVKGNDYIIWKLSDLRDCQRLVRVFLFGDECLNKLCNVVCGTVVALLNASPMPKQDNAEKDDMLSLKIDNGQKVLELGHCPDFGFCKGNRRTDNKRCTSVVNKSMSEFCDFHVLTAYKKFASKRGELQLNSNNPPKILEKKLAANSSGLTTVKIFPSFHQTTSSSNKPKVSELLCRVADGAKVTGSTVDGDKKSVGDKNDNFVDLLRRPTLGSRNLLKQISQPTIAGTISSDVEKCASTATISSGRQFLASCNVKSSASSDAAKSKAVSLIKSKYDGHLLKQDSNNPPVYKRPPIRGELLKTTGDSSSNELIQSPLRKRQKLGDLDVKKEKLDELLAKTSKHENLVEKDDLERQETYFKAMESKEKVEQRPTEIMSLKHCKVVSCKTCNYTWHSQSDMCKRLDHKVLWHNAEKKFFKCKHCNKRVVSYTKYPTKPCTECNSTTYERVAMRDEKHGPKLGGEQLKIRGDEEPFLS